MEYGYVYILVSRMELFACLVFSSFYVPMVGSSSSFLKFKDLSCTVGELAPVPHQGCSRHKGLVTGSREQDRLYGHHK